MKDFYSKDVVIYEREEFVIRLNMFFHPLIQFTLQLQINCVEGVHNYFLIDILGIGFQVYGI